MNHPADPSPRRLPASLAAVVAEAVPAGSPDRSARDAAVGPVPARSLRLVGLSGGVGEPSSTTTLVDLVLAEAARRLREQGHDVDVDVVEVREIARDATDEVLGGLRTPRLDAAMRTVEAADGLVVATPVFRGSYAGVLKTVLDLLEAGSLRGIPTVLAATSGTARHTLVTEHALRPLLSYLGALTLPTTVVATPDELVLGTRPVPELASRIERAGGELATHLR